MYSPPQVLQASLHFCSNIADSVTMLLALACLNGKNFLWVELHGNCTSQSMLESGSCGHFVWVFHICRTQFMWRVMWKSMESATF